MENLTYLERIREVYPKLKGVEKKVVEYIMQNPERIIKLSITELSEECDSGEATIFRVCKKLGYKGYQELKIKIASEVIEPIKDIHEEVSENDNILIIDDVVANGWAAEGLYDICVQAGATVAGIGCAIEKAYQQGGKRLRSKGIRIESLAKIEEIDLEERKVKFCLE